MHDTATRVVSDASRPWLPIGGEAGNFMKIYHVDEANEQVVLAVKFAPNAVYPRHKHLGPAVAYTLEGEWEYEEGKLPVGTFALEPADSDHLPIVSDKGATILAILKARDGVFNEVPMPDGTIFKQDLAYFKKLYNMTAEEAAAENAVGVTMTTSKTAA